MSQSNAYPLRRLARRDVAGEGALVLSAMGITGWFLGVLAAAGFWTAFALVLVVLCGELVGLKHVDQQARDTSPA
jgi:hypothetical protein